MCNGRRGRGEVGSGLTVTCQKQNQTKTPLAAASDKMRNCSQRGERSWICRRKPKLKDVQDAHNSLHLHSPLSFIRSCCCCCYYLLVRVCGNAINLGRAKQWQMLWHPVQICGCPADTSFDIFAKALPAFLAHLHLPLSLLLLLRSAWNVASLSVSTPNLLHLYRKLRCLCAAQEAAACSSLPSPFPSPLRIVNC